MILVIKIYSSVILLLIGIILVIPSFSIVESNGISIIDAISNQNLDKKFFPTLNFTNEEIKMKKGSLEINDVILPITYELKNGIPIFEEDIILNNENINGKAAIDKFLYSAIWTNSEIPIAIHPEIPNRDKILQALLYVMDNTNIKFKELTLTPNKIVDASYVLIVPHPTSCASNLGMVGGQQLMFIADGCETGNIIHTIGHLIGLWHEQTRCDRNQFIEVVEDNIKKDRLTQFSTICDPDDPNNAFSPISFGPYDFCSIMHYGAFSTSLAINPELPIIKPLKQVVGCNDIGQRVIFSQGDLAAISSIYG